MKCGTTAIHDYLDAHPSVAMSRPKEINFFFDADPSGPEWAGTARRGVAWYRSHFDPATPVRGESSPGYTSPSHPDVADRMAALIPDAKLVMMVRDPVARAVSQWRHHHRDGTERRPVDVALLDPESQYISRSRYHERLTPFLERFGAAQIAVIALEELEREPETVLPGVFRFLDIDDRHWCEDYRRPVHTAGTTTAPAALRQTTRRALAERLRDDADRLRDFVGRDFPGWTV